MYDSRRVRWCVDEDGTMVQNEVNVYLTTVAEQWQERWKELFDMAGGGKDSSDGDDDIGSADLLKLIKKKGLRITKDGSTRKVAVSLRPGTAEAPPPPPAIDSDASDDELADA